MNSACNWGDDGPESEEELDRDVNQRERKEVKANAITKDDIIKPIKKISSLIKRKDEDRIK